MIFRRNCPSSTFSSVPLTRSSDRSGAPRRTARSSTTMWTGDEVAELITDRYCIQAPQKLAALVKVQPTKAEGHPKGADTSHLLNGLPATWSRGTRRSCERVDASRRATETRLGASPRCHCRGGVLVRGRARMEASGRRWSCAVGSNHGDLRRPGLRFGHAPAWTSLAIDAPRLHAAQSCIRFSPSLHSSSAPFAGDRKVPIHLAS